MRTLIQAVQAKNDTERKVYFGEMELLVYHTPFSPEKITAALNAIAEEAPWTNTRLRDNTVGTGPAIVEAVQAGRQERFTEDSYTIHFFHSSSKPGGCRFAASPDTIGLKLTQLVAYENYAAMVGQKIKAMEIKGVKISEVRASVNYRRYCGDFR